MNKHSKIIVIVSGAAIAVMFFIERFMQPGYIVKSLCKLVLFGGTILFLKKSDNTPAVIHKKAYDIQKLKLCALLGIGTYVLIIAGYFLLADFIDAKQITDNLLAKENITAQNFIFVALYISFINSLLEESFFRGMLFLKLGSTWNRRAAFILSAFLFSVYHIGIMTSWFSPMMFVLIVGLLFIAGLVLNLFCEWGKSFVASWVIHIAANFSINTIGFIMLLK